MDAMDKGLTLPLNRCCNSTEMSQNKSGNSFECENGNEANVTCQHPSHWQKHDWKEVAINETADGPQVTFRVAEKLPKLLVDGEYCVGAILDEGRDILKGTFMDCHTPCRGNTPCFR